MSADTATPFNIAWLSASMKSSALITGLFPLAPNNVRFVGDTLELRCGSLKGTVLASKL